MLFVEKNLLVSILVLKTRQSQRDEICVGVGPATQVKLIPLSQLLANFAAFYYQHMQTP